MTELYIETIINVKGETIISIDSYVVLYLYEFLKSKKDIKLFFVKNNSTPDYPLLKLDQTKFDINANHITASDNNILNDLKLPILIRNGICVAGLCAVCRDVIKASGGTNFRKDLLGFKEACLLSPAENSIWTKFCEIDVVSAVEFILNYDFEKTATDTPFHLPIIFAKFETHMSQPVKLHNVYKLAREKANKSRVDSQIGLDEQGKKVKKVQIESSVPIEKLNIEHIYAEGCFLTLADVILYSCIALIIKIMPNTEKLKELLPRTFKWLEMVSASDAAFDATFQLFYHMNQFQKKNVCISYSIDIVNNFSLYKNDPKRYNAKDRLFTRQDSVEESLTIFNNLDINANSEDFNKFFDTSKLKDSDKNVSYPNKECLPNSRLTRKTQQLDNLANSIISLSKDNDRIIDFCSGSGHLGIILASKLPKCHIIFVENKAISLKRAKDRADQLGLNNCSFYQSNLDYFIGKFNIGTSLHACGTATDIVLWQCVRNNAIFVCCPCCYGSVNPMPHISYPRSKKFQSFMNQKNYLHIAHAADQSHDSSVTECNPEKSIQGQYCMDIIDTDRKIMAEEYGYKVILTKLKPVDCTPKNRLLIGVI